MKRKEYTSYDQLPIVLSVEDIAAVLRIGINNAYELVRSEEIPSKKIKGQYKIPKGALQTYMTV